MNASDAANVDFKACLEAEVFQPLEIIDTVIDEQVKKKVCSSQLVLVNNFVSIKDPMALGDVLAPSPPRVIPLGRS